MKARDLKTFLFYLMKFVIFVNISFRISDTSRQHINLENAKPPATWRESRESKFARVPLTKNTDQRETCLAIGEACKQVQEGGIWSHSRRPTAPLENLCYRLCSNFQRPHSFKRRSKLLRVVPLLGRYISVVVRFFSH